MTCDTLEIALDYADLSSSKTLTLQLAKITGTEKPNKKSVLLSFGDPGENSLTDLNNSGAELEVIFAGHVDLIAFNTVFLEGVGNTLPFSCYNNTAESMNAPMEATIYTNASDTAVASAWAAATNYANTCCARMKNMGDLFGTAFIARDMMEIVDALEEDGLLHYWSFSYGTVLGATVAAMFPYRMGSVVLDGVLNPYEYCHGYDNQQLARTDDILDGFCSSWLEAPKLCPLSTIASSGIPLKEKLYKMLDSIKYHPIPVGASLLDYVNVKGMIFNDLYNPVDWPTLSNLLFSVMTRNVTALVEFMAAQSASTATSQASIMLGFEKAYHTSRKTGDVNVHINMECAQWKKWVKEHYMGDFRVKTHNPVLLIGNTWDPATPSVSAQNVSNALEESVLLRHNG
ncbi:hypothetical protein N7481_000007 [Penicillium waksmanii]|uniref:uncharacterized protein n=1 Tax=Penicillium waksmanii TaxID=69791 RepID=UPI002548F38F|nr:uncharacterized protein N7481_000007 [Penicillium waksmanii]KAJ5999598.1 hypothetical protein N7481_000007 [Penicillium waksmanii]